MKAANKAVLSALNDNQLKRAIYSNWDFQQALSALTFLLEECDFEAKYNRIQLRKFRCYETNVIISFARPFEKTRSGGTLSLKALGIRLDDGERALKEKVMGLRRRVIAHSEEEYMHFKGSVIQPFEDIAVAMPMIQYRETLYLTLEELGLLEGLLRKLRRSIAKLLFEVAQSTPSRLEEFKQPKSSSC